MIFYDLGVLRTKGFRFRVFIGSLGFRVFNVYGLVFLNVFFYFLRFPRV